jgi:hypothetical protein
MAKKRMRSDEPIEPAIATPEEAERFFKSLQSRFPERPRTRTEKKRLRKFLAQFNKEKLQSVMRRAVVSLVQHRGPVLPRGGKREE